jgi:hypothetical protein
MFQIFTDKAIPKGPEKKNKKTYRLRLPQRLLNPPRSSPSINTHPPQRQKLIIRQHKRTPMICFQIIDLLSKHHLPQIFTDEFNHI